MKDRRHVIRTLMELKSLIPIAIFIAAMVFGWASDPVVNFSWKGHYLFPRKVLNGCVLHGTHYDCAKETVLRWAQPEDLVPNKPTNPDGTPTR